MSLAAGTGALLAAEFGLGPWLLVPLLAWLTTFGLPTTLAVVGCATLWSGGGLTAFLLVAAGAALAAQLGVALVLSRRTA